MIALRGDLLDFTATPLWGSTAEQGVRWRPDHWLMIDDAGRISGATTEEPGPQWQRIDHRGKLVMPGFIDTHVHCPQLEVIASWGTGLLDWLETYTFPAERCYADAAVAEAGAAQFLDALLAHGTTSAVVFPTVHKVSADRLFAAAQKRGMRLITGKVLMDVNAPDDLRDDVQGAERDCRELIQQWHGTGRLAYAATVRFAATSSREQLAMAGRLCREFAGTFMQTHVAENRDEVRWVAELFPEARSYLDIYHRHGLLHERAVLAHGIWLDAQDRALLRDTGAQIAHSPSSNLFLGSGLFDWQAAHECGHKVSVASEVGGGTSLSMQRTLADAYKVQALRGTKLSAFTGLHAATLGAAQGLGLQAEIGHLGAGALADITVWDWAVGPVAGCRDAVSSSLHSRLFAWMMLGDERNLVQTFVAGTSRYQRRP